MEDIKPMQQPIQVNDTRGALYKNTETSARRIPNRRIETENLVWRWKSNLKDTLQNENFNSTIEQNQSMFKAIYVGFFNKKTNRYASATLNRKCILTQM